MIDIQIHVDDTGRVSWRSSSPDMAQTHWWLTLVGKLILDQAVQPKPASAIVEPGPLRFGKVS